MIRMLSGIIDARLRHGTRLIDITAMHTNPQITEKIPNSVVREFVRQNYERYAESSTSANQFLLDEAQRLK